MKLLITISIYSSIIACSAPGNPKHSSNQSPRIKSEVINGKPIIDEIKFILDHKPVYASPTLSLEKTKERNRSQMDRIEELQLDVETHALINTPFNRIQQKSLANGLESLLEHREDIEQTAVLSQSIYINTIALYQCNSNLIAELRTSNPSSKTVPALLQLNLEIERSKFAIYDFSRSEFKAWSELNKTEIKLNSLFDFYQSMDTDPKSMFYLEKEPNRRTYVDNTESLIILNSCLYIHNQVDKQLQDILFNYELLAQYNKSLKALRKLYRQTNLR